jgi:predicted molibdopterin-dependent oxidoreductase YjgC
VEDQVSNVRNDTIPPLALAVEENFKNGAKVIVIDPRRIPIVDRAEIFFE